jgi:hypothetical protein
VDRRLYQMLVVGSTPAWINSETAVKFMNSLEVTK